MGRYELILKLDGALWPRIILKLLLTPKGAIEDPTNPKKVLKSAPNQPSFCFRVNSFRFDNSFRLDSDHVEDTDNEDVGTDNEDVGTDKDKREMQPRKMVSISDNHCITVSERVRKTVNGEWRHGVKHKGSTRRITSKDLCTAEAVAIDCCWRS